MSYNANHLSRTSWSRVTDIIKRRDKGICQYCDKYSHNGEVDHILPLSKGGRDSIDNLVWSCTQCNREKQGKTLREWLLSIKGAANKTFAKTTTLSKPATMESLCTKWLLEFVTRDGISCNDVIRAASKLGFRDSMVERTKRIINNDHTQKYMIKSIRVSSNWLWKLEERINGNST